MYECLLCKKDMKTSKDTFGKGCIKNIYSFLNLNMPRKVNIREKKLYEDVMKLTNTKAVNKSQKIWLTDRYLTYMYLDKIEYGNFDKLKEDLNKDIADINKASRFEELITAKKIQLKQAYDLYKKCTKFTEGIKQIRKGNFTDEESIKLLKTTISYIFNMAKNKSKYDKDLSKAMQYAFWQTVIEVGREYAEFDISADFLQHSLERNPKDLLITKGKVVEEIIADSNFKENINNIVKKCGKNNSFIFDSSINTNFTMNFNNSDLYFAIHCAALNIKGEKINSKWNLEIKLHDRYDYSEFKHIWKYYNDTSSALKSAFSSTLYNFAWMSSKNSVMKEYDIDIQFKLTDFEVIE